MSRSIRVLLLAFLMVGVLLCGIARADGSGDIYVLEVDGTIVPVVKDYIDRVLDDAEADGATAAVILLDTPGGLMDSTQEIVERILNARVPVIVYVSPSGARAASAGVFITMSAHVAAMAPGTTIGAAHPVSGSGEDLSDTMEKKVTEYSVAWVRSIAEQRGRNADWAETAVRESAALTDVSALEQNVIDLRADDLDSLLRQVDGMTVQVGDEQIVLDTTGYRLVEKKMSFFERFLHTISDPNIAYILLSVGSLGIILELFHPGSIFPGVVGVISLVMAFYSLSVLNADWAGIALVLLAFGLFVAEIFTPTFGLLTAGGIAALVFGSLIVFSGDTGGFGMDIDWWVILVVLVFVLAVFGFLLQAVVRTQRRKQPTGADGMIGEVAAVKTPLMPTGTVFIHGELWQATLDEGQADAGEEVIVTEVEGLKLHVIKKE